MLNFSKDTQNYQSASVHLPTKKKKKSLSN